MIAASIWIFKQIVEYLKKDKEKDDELTSLLIKDLRTDRANLLQGNQDGFNKVVQAVGVQTVRTTEELRDLSHLISKFSETLHFDVQKTLTSQTDIYTANLRELQKMRETLQQLETNTKMIIEEFISNKNSS